MIGVRAGCIAATGVVTSSPLIAEFTYTTGSYSPDNKNMNRGYSNDFVNSYGTIDVSSFNLADGTTITTDSFLNTTISSEGFEFKEFLPQFGNDTLIIVAHFIGNTSPPAFTDANWFKTLRIINNTQGTTEDILRSAFTASAVDVTSPDSKVTIFMQRVAVTSNNDSITVQLRSD